MITFRDKKLLKEMQAISGLSQGEMLSKCIEVAHKITFSKKKEEDDSKKQAISKSG